jgi:hypothetical protein
MATKRKLKFAKSKPGIYHEILANFAKEVRAMVRREIRKKDSEQGRSDRLASCATAHVDLARLHVSMARHLLAHSVGKGKKNKRG